MNVYVLQVELFSHGINVLPILSSWIIYAGNTVLNYKILNNEYSDFVN